MNTLSITMIEYTIFLFEFGRFSRLTTTKTIKMSNSILPIKYMENKTPYIEFGTYEIRLESEKPDAETQRIAIEELRETPDIVQPAIEELRNLLKGKWIIDVFINVMFCFFSIRIDAGRSPHCILMKTAFTRTTFLLIFYFRFRKPASDYSLPKTHLKFMNQCLQSNRRLERLCHVPSYTVYPLRLITTGFSRSYWMITTVICHLEMYKKRTQGNDFLSRNIGFE